MPYSSRFLHSGDKPDIRRPTLPGIANPELIMTNSPPVMHREAAPPSPPPASRVPRKRAASINVEEANKATLQGLNISTPTCVAVRTDIGRDSICLCTQAPKIPRPRNGT